MNKILLSILVIAAVHASGQDKITGDISPIFDISPDNKTIAVSAINGQSSALYLYSIKDKTVQPLAGLENDYFVRPRFSPKGDKLLYISKSNTGKDICLMDLATRKASHLDFKMSNGYVYVTEAIFNSSGDKIIFCGAMFVGNYSPVARKAPHDIDIFSVNLDGTGIKKITNYAAYSLNSISLDKSGDSILCALTAGSHEGIYKLSIKDTGKARKIETVNNPRPMLGADFYGIPNYSQDNKYITFIAPYQLMVLDMTTLKCDELWSTLGKDNQAMPMWSEFFSSGDKVIFTSLAIKDRQYTSDASFYIVNIKTKELTELKLK